MIKNYAKNSIFNRFDLYATETSALDVLLSHKFDFEPERINNWFFGEMCAYVTIYTV